MISICIPVYNTNVIDLVKNLVQQIQKVQKECEVIVVDDGSDLIFRDANKPITALPFVLYVELPVNSGRVEARKHLCSLSQFEWLLFIDADSTITCSDFLYKYISCCTQKSDVIVGGRVYNHTPPSDCKLMLHWKYGCQREKALKGRFVFMTNNFCIRKKVFQQIDFPSALHGYGHEDTWMGMDLQQKHAAIEFIENPVLHNGLEKAPVFLEKSKNALQNLKALAIICNKETLQSHVKLFRYYNIVQKLKVSSLLIYFENFLHQAILKNLLSCQASLLVFDFFRLCYFIKLKHHQASNID